MREREAKREDNTDDVTEMMVMTLMIIIRFGIGRLVGEIHNEMQTAIDNKKEKKKVLIYSGKVACMK